MFQQYLGYALESSVCLLNGNNENYPGHFFFAEHKDVNFFYYMMRNTLLEGIFPGLTFYCDCFVRPARSLIAEQLQYCASNVELKGELMSKKPWPKVDSLKHCQEVGLMFESCQFVTYDPARRLCWLYSNTEAIYPSDRLLSSPKSCKPGYQDKKYYSMNDFAQIWTGNPSETVMIETMKSQFFDAVDQAPLGFRCHDIPTPVHCQSIGGTGFAIAYDPHGCLLQTQNNATCTEMEANPQHWCGICHVQDQQGAYQNVLLDIPDQLALKCNGNGEKTLCIFQP